MNSLLILIIVLLCFIVYFYCSNRNQKDKNNGLEAFESIESIPIKPKKEYKDEVDYFMTPVAQAIRMENGMDTNKKVLYDTYNEAVKRYNEVGPKVKEHPRVPNIETVVRQRDRVYEELQNEPPVETVIVAVEPQRAVPMQVPIPITPPVLIKKDKKRENRLKFEVKSSAQNVHDHNVNDELARRYNGLKKSKLARDESKSYLDMLEFINKHDKSKRKIVRGFDAGDGLSRFYYDNEATIWFTVWRRIHSPENKDNVDDLKQSLANAVEDCNEDGELVCTTGRATRALNSLTLMDKDEKISAPIKTDDIKRKEAYDKAYQILQEELDKKGKTFKDKYESGEMEDREVETFDNGVKGRIREGLADSPYINDALAAI